MFKMSNLPNHKSKNGLTSFSFSNKIRRI